ncbi:MAG: hypothetical protein Q9191_003184 [Dirinaria sp. TL-2023a]
MSERSQTESWFLTTLPSPAPRKSHSVHDSSTPPKYCSDRCRREKPPAHGQGIEATIERAFVQMLGPFESGGGRTSAMKIVLCGEVEARVFGSPIDRGKRNNGENTSSEERFDGKIMSGDERKEEEQEEDESDGGVAIHETRAGDDGNQNSEADLTPQQAGRRRAANREKVRQAARRGVVFGFPIDIDGYTARDTRYSSNPEASQTVPSRIRAEAVQGGRVVEASFAKGEWGVRWRDGI